ncbi:hypothetical protein IG7_02914 [Bacillus cereus HuA2-4]|nr:hypothetical protein IG7_02914 [Bacillus cereus HuA2-4]
MKTRSKITCASLALLIAGSSLLFIIFTHIRNKGIYPALTGSKPPTSKFSGSKEVRWGLIKVSLYINYVLIIRV